MLGCVETIWENEQDLGTAATPREGMEGEAAGWREPGHVLNCLPGMCIISFSNKKETAMPGHQAGWATGPPPPSLCPAWAPYRDANQLLCFGKITNPDFFYSRI